MADKKIEKKLEMLDNQKVIKFNSQAKNIAIVEQLVDELCEQFSIPEDNYGNILISLTEAVNNAIVHGNKLDPEKEVSLAWNREDNILKFIIEDEGPGFDFENVPDPTAPENIEKPNGRGVFLMRHLADRCEFKDDGRIVEIEFDGISD